MYYPYIRGRQYELIALRELLEKNLLSKKIIPIIEPVKLSSTLTKTLLTYTQINRELGFVINPNVGTFNAEIKSLNKGTQEEFLNIIKNSNVIKTCLVEKYFVDVLDEWNKKIGIQNNNWCIINNNREYLSNFLEIYGASNSPRLTLIPDESSFRRSIRENKILLEDRFEKMSRNVDYSENEDELFSEDHLYYLDDGYYGFSDYSIIGSDYSEGGFAPYAVAIHIVYFTDDKKLRVRHFVSDSNSTIEDTAGKFYEAVKKLAKWVKNENITPTESLNIILKHYEDGTYPGLGSLKKLSLMHHFELIGKYLDEVS